MMASHSRQLLSEDLTKLTNHEITKEEVLQRSNNEVHSTTPITTPERPPPLAKTKPNKKSITAEKQKKSTQKKPTTTEKQKKANQHTAKISAAKKRARNIFTTSLVGFR